MWRKKYLHVLLLLGKSIFLRMKLSLARFGVFFFFFFLQTGNSIHVQLDINVLILSF